LGAIDLGPASLDRGSNVGGFSLVAKENPANDSGTIDTVTVYFSANSGNFDVATCTEDGSNNITTTRDDETTAGGYAAGEHAISVSLNVVTGDYAGCYVQNSGSLERDLSGADGYWYKSGDNIPCTAVAYSWATPRTISLYMTGETPAAATFIPRVIVF